MTIDPGGLAFGAANNPGGYPIGGTISYLGQRDKSPEKACRTR